MATETSRPARTLSLRTATLLVVANIIGTGIFTTTGVMLGHLGSAWATLALWGLGGIVALAGALCYAELSAAIPQNGADATLLARIIHPAAGFMAAIVSLVVGFAGPVAGAALSLEAYLRPFLPDALPPKLLGGVVILTLTWLHGRDVKGGAAAQDAITLPKVVILAALALIGIALGHPTALGQGDPTPAATALLSAAMPIAFIQVAYAYSGWNGAAYVAGEVVSPERNLPRALIFGTLIVTGVYLAMNLAYLGSAPVATLAGREDIGAAVAEALLGPTAARVIAIVIGVGYVSAIGAWILAGPRVYAATGEAHPRLAWLAARNERGAPTNAVWFQTALTLVLFVRSDLQSLLTFMGILLSLSASLTVLGVIVLRIREPNLVRPYRVPLYPLTPLVSGGILLWMIGASLIEDPSALRWCGVTLGAGLLLHAWVSRGPRRGGSDS